jgi:hypothetical protein
MLLVTLNYKKLTAGKLLENNQFSKVLYKIHSYFLINSAPKSNKNSTAIITVEVFIMEWFIVLLR